MKIARWTVPALLAALLLGGRALVATLPDSALLDAVSRWNGLSPADRVLLGNGYDHLGNEDRAESSWIAAAQAAGTGTVGARSWYDVGNVRFERALETADPVQRKSQAQSSADAYIQSLDMRPDAEARANLEAVQKLLEDTENSGASQPDANTNLLSASGSAREGATGSGESESDTGSDIPPVSATGAETDSGSADSGAIRPGDGEQGGFTDSGTTSSLGRKFGPGTAPLTPDETARLGAIESQLEQLQAQRGQLTRPDGTKPSGQTPQDVLQELMGGSAISSDLGGNDGDY